MLSIDARGRARAMPVLKLLPAAVLAFGLAACSSDENATRDAAGFQGGNFDFEGWDQYLGGGDSSQYSSLNEPEQSNVGRLEAAWTYATGANCSYHPVVGANLIAAPRT